MKTAVLNSETAINASATSPLRHLTSLRVWNPGENPIVAAPLSRGIDLPKGLVTKPARLSLSDAPGRPLPLQSEPLAWWSDGSIKWLLVDALVSNLEPGWSELPLLIDEREVPVPTTSLLSPDATVSDPCSVELVKSGLRIRRGGSTVSLAFPLTTESGRRVLPRIKESVWETRGPVRWTLRIEGEFPGCRGLRFVARLHSYFPTGLLKLDVRLHNPRRARHKGGLWDLGDAGSIRFRAFDVEVAPAGNGSGAELTWQSEPSRSQQTSKAGPVQIYQASSGKENWQSSNHVNAAGEVPCQFRGYKVHAPGRENSGEHAQPLFHLTSDHQSLSICVPEFWQQFPNALHGGRNGLRAGLFPETNGKHELQGGEQKTQTVWISADNEPHVDVIVSMPGEWIATCNVIPWFDARTTEAHSHVDRFLREALGNQNSWEQRRDVIDEYGWRNFGDVHADHEQRHFDGDSPVVSHYNNQFDLIFGGVLNLAATGDARWFDLFEPLARHVMDIDIYHTTDDRSCFNGGLFWHTDHFVDAHTSTHRTYSKHNAGDNGGYGGGPSNEHNYTTGLLHYYFLTGSREAHDSVLSLADWVIAMDDGSKTIFGAIDSGPTGLASQTVFEDFHGPGRGAGNSINALVDAWTLTGNPQYITKAEELIRRVVHPRLNCHELHLHDAEGHWSYTVCMLAIGRYLSAKLEAEQLDESYAYARESLDNIGRWMVEHERPTLSAPVKLELPTVAWAAQDFRKANVLRIAASCTDDPAAENAMRRKADELNDAAWKDFTSFGDQHLTARCLSILMTEGLRDVFHRKCQPEYMPPTTQKFDWDVWEMFVPQKQRVKQMLKNPMKLAIAMTRLLNPVRVARTVDAMRRQL